MSNVKILERDLLTVALAHSPLVQLGVYRINGARLPEGLPRSLHDDISLNIEPGNPQNNRNLELLDDGFSTTLSFNGVPFDVFVPWSALQRIYTNEFVIILPNRIVLPPPPPPAKPGLRRVK